MKSPQSHGGSRNTGNRAYHWVGAQGLSRRCRSWQDAPPDRGMLGGPGTRTRESPKEWSFLNLLRWFANYRPFLDFLTP